MSKIEELKEVKKKPINWKESKTSKTKEKVRDILVKRWATKKDRKGGLGGLGWNKDYEFQFV